MYFLQRTLFTILTRFPFPDRIGPESRPGIGNMIINLLHIPAFLFFGHTFVLNCVAETHNFNVDSWFVRKNEARQFSKCRHVPIQNIILGRASGNFIGRNLMGFVSSEPQIECHWSALCLSVPTTASTATQCTLQVSNAFLYALWFSSFDGVGM